MKKDTLLELRDGTRRVLQLRELMDGVRVRVGVKIMKIRFENDRYEALQA